MKLNHETSNVAAFSRNLERELENLGHSAYIAPTDHQDVRLGADVLASDGRNFSLIEFKDEKRDAASEARKPRRKTLCRRLDGWSDIHASCHLIGWRSRQGSSIEFPVRSYGTYVCTPAIIQLPQADITFSSTISIQCETVQEFAQAMVSQKVGVDFQHFRDYVRWLLSLDDDTDDKGENDDANDVELLMCCVVDGKLYTKEFANLAELKLWIDNAPGPSPRRTFVM
ncbi:hypothetical protein I5V32_01595 [Stenotrophomonas maltophilia]|uniref:Uncharacterized protein n=1 Tax=Stenotrophomonas maltophilia TaxID=40324 RepID=A0AA41CLH0_STEMA|nr:MULTISPECIES: hypothetical protein [Stenotrophomonas]MBH1583821.1 hypothetical protein [Stenotrophomonas maltophilia]MBH1714843.1 hypothetical protein [Stenotrophomonas maltophilia]MBH1791271.1 hypothetical protein [Stenotrophomonas maltophilia]MCR1820339.1 hypothetical protein [Stenotrophomonas muris]MCU1072453.1 hypothetical protein [Stenotrophomonas maltophilia]